ncbi:hypothetical protein BGY98DRAFT_315391 [Russula aff. rugulosa BPL654]|nr:hypothetical protein BGY98DRAFT_315391 [Russula aff. rugulosa BPL654]
MHIYSAYCGWCFLVSVTAHDFSFKTVNSQGSASLANATSHFLHARGPRRLSLHRSISLQTRPRGIYIFASWARYSAPTSGFTYTNNSHYLILISAGSIFAQGPRLWEKKHHGIFDAGSHCDDGRISGGKWDGCRVWLE